jgi:hypothetical protein
MGLVGCAYGPAPKAPPPAPAAEPDPEVVVSEPVMLVAPDEKEEAAASQRLLASKTIGGAGDDGVYGPRPRGALRPGALRPAPGTATSQIPYRPAFGRVYGRGYAPGGTANAIVAGAVGTGAGGGTPAVGGNWASAPSYGPRQMK